MIGSIIGILLALILFGVLIWGVQQILAIIPMPEIFKRVINVVIVILIVFVAIWVVVQLLGVAGVRIPMMG